MNATHAKLISAGLLLLAAVLLALYFDGCREVQSDTVMGYVHIEWECVGDDMLVGLAKANDGRWSNDSLQLKNNWNACAIWPGIDTLKPLTPGTTQGIDFGVRVELDVPYYFAHKTIDDRGNAARISNILTFIWPDTIASAATAIRGHKR